MAALILAYGAAITSLGPGPGDLDARGWAGPSALTVGLYTS